MPSRSRSASPRIDTASALVLLLFAAIVVVAAVVRGVPLWADLLYVGASVLCFVLYAVDKAAAIDGRDRMPESILLSLGLIGGWPGAIVAQQVLRHKTAKWTFRVRFWISVGVNIAIFVWMTASAAR